MNIVGKRISSGVKLDLNGTAYGTAYGQAVLEWIRIETFPMIGEEVNKKRKKIYIKLP